MQRLFILLLVLPWWAYFPLAGGVGYLAEMSYRGALAEQAEKAAALAEAPPPVVDLSTLRRDADIHAADEVHVRGRIDTDRNYELIKRTNGVRTGTRFMYMMFGSQDVPGAQVVRAAMVLTKAQRDAFVDRIDDFMVAEIEGRPVFDLNGFGELTGTYAALAYDAIGEQGLKRSDDFIFVEPFLEGRAAALAPKGVPMKTRGNGWLIALGVALFGVVRWYLKRATAGPRTPGDGHDAGPISGPGQPAVPLAKSIAPNSPLGRIAARRAPPEAQQPARARVASGNVAVRRVVPRAVNAPAPEAPPVSPAPRTGFDLAFLVKVGLGMAVVGLVSYDPGLISRMLPMALPLALMAGTLLFARRLRRAVTAIFTRGGDKVV